MRLLDAISHGRCAAVRPDDGRVLPGAERFAEDIRACPLRYVLSDELARRATQLAYAEGDRLSACLDLIRMPARSLWVEWSDPPRMEALEHIPSLQVNRSSRNARRAGVLVEATRDCRAGSIRTFWSGTEDAAYVCPMVTTFDLDRPLESRVDPRSLWCGEARLQMAEEPAIDELLQHLRFRFDDEWAAYYRERCETLELRDEILRANLGCCAFDGPMLMAFALLLSALDVLPRRLVEHVRLNHTRRRLGKPPLLEHVEVHAPLGAPARAPGRDLLAGTSRASPRMHHVRGHIVRRGTAVFWRVPHLRGNARLGGVRTRTVTLRFH